MDYNTLLQKFPGYQGWGQTEALADFRATGGAGKGPPSSGGGGGSSGGGFDVNAFLKAQQDRQDALVAQQKAATDARFAQGKTDVTDFMGRYNTTVPGLFDTVNTKYNVPFWATTANAIKNRLDELRGNTNNAGAGGYANAEQVDRAINTNILPRYAQAEGTFQTASKLAQNEYGARIAPFETESKMLSERLAREATGYNIQQQNELDALLKTMASGTQLGAAQMERATKLAELENTKLIKEEEFANELQKTRLQNERFKALGKYGAVSYDANGNPIIVGGNTNTGVGTNPNNYLTPPDPNQMTPFDWNSYGLG